MRIKKYIISIMVIVSVYIMSGCKFNTYKSFTYGFTTGEKLTIKLDTTGGYDMKAEKEMVIIFDGNNEEIGAAGGLEYERFAEVQKILDSLEENTESDVFQLISKSDEENKTRYFYKENKGDTTFYEYVVVFDDSNIVGVFESIGTQESVDIVIDRIEFSVK